MGAKRTYRVAPVPVDPRRTYLLEMERPVKGGTVASLLYAMPEPRELLNAFCCAVGPVAGLATALVSVWYVPLVASEDRAGYRLLRQCVVDLDAARAVSLADCAVSFRAGQQVLIEVTPAVDCRLRIEVVMRRPRGHT